MKRNFVSPEMSISCFDSENVVTGSGLQTDAYNSITSESGSLKVDGKKLEAGQILSITF